MYEIVMPQLSDSMEEGKLIAWKKSVGDAVNTGDVIAEVESDKAIMEVQSFKGGILKEILAKEGDVVSVGEVIAKIETKNSTVTEEKAAPQEEKEVSKAQKTVVEEKVVERPKPEKKEEAEEKKSEPELQRVTPKHLSKESLNGISPKARAKAAFYGIDTDQVLQKSAANVLHVDDVQEYVREHYFTPKALKLLDAYGLDIATFELNHKIDETEVQEYITKHETPLPKKLSQMQKAIIANVTASAQKPVYHIFEDIDAKLFLENERYSITAWLIKIFAKVMMTHSAFRSRIVNDGVSVSPNASISVAVANEKDLYMPVVKDANRCSIAEIAEQLAGFKTKLQNNSFSAQDMQGSNFGISNLGMLGVERFDAMINKEDSAIAAIGTLQNDKISVTLTADHRVINGYEAALFMRDVKKEAQNPLNFKE